MGQNTDALLMYGIDYGGEMDMDELAKSHGFDPDDEDFEFDWEVVHSKVLGVEDPKIKYEGDGVDIYHDYWDAKRKALAAAPCEIDKYCSCDYPMLIACVKKSRYHASRGEAIEVQDGLKAKPEWDQQLKDFCELMKLPYSEPKWYLVSMWC